MPPPYTPLHRLIESLPRCSVLLAAHAAKHPGWTKSLRTTAARRCVACGPFSEYCKLLRLVEN
jgi:hypothetical protein